VRLGNHEFRLDESLRRHTVAGDDGLFLALKDHLKPGGVFLDIGANIGLYSLMGAQLVGAEGKVFAFEPDPSNFALLRRNVELNGMGSVVAPQQMALGEHADAGGVTFYSPARGGSPESSLVSKGANMRSVTVPLDTLDAFCERSGVSPDLIKIDTEGAEWPIIQGGLGVIRAKKPLLVVEYHGSKTLDFGYSVDELWRNIDDLGYRQSFVMKGGDSYFMTLCLPS